MVNVPFIFIFKVGITSLAIGAGKRAKAIDKAMPGLPVPIFILPVPGAYYIEQEMHKIMRHFKFSFYRGDGHTETFLLAPLIFAIPVMLSVWGVYLYAFDYFFHTTILPTLARWFFYSLFYLIGI